jgi:hypothetical protein
VRLSLVACGVLSAVALGARLPAARAEGVFTEFTGTRSGGMGGAHTGIGNSNDALYLNPAGMVLSRRYNLAVQYGYSPFDRLSHFNFSVVDSKSGPVTGAAAFTRDWGDPLHANADISRIYVGSAYPLSDALAFGATARYVRGNYTDVATGGREKVSVVGGDLGVIARLGDAVGLGVSYQNLLTNHDSPFTHEILRGGVALSLGSLVVAGDARKDLTSKTSPALFAGAEYFMQNTAALRLGYNRTPYVRKKDGVAAMENMLTAGLGWVDSQGSLDVGYQQSLERNRNKVYMVGMQLFL